MPEVTRRVIHWFRRDLRLANNRALEAALATGDEVVPVFILDHRLLARPTIGAARRRFLLASLQDLDRSLRDRGSALVVGRAADPVRELNRLAHEVGAWALYYNRDYTPYARDRDQRATRGMQMTGVVTMAFDDLLLVAPHALMGEDGLVPVTYGAFSRRWFSVLDVPTPPRAPTGAFVAANLLPRPAPSWQAVLTTETTPSSWPGATQTSARARLDDFVTHGLGRYSEARDFPAEAEGSSRLSAALRFGTISVRDVAAAALRVGAADDNARASAERFIRELGWRDFAHHVLFTRPRRLREELHRRPWKEPRIAQQEADRRFEAWCLGLTGLPMVDAAMRQLSTEGWMHNRSRMLAASFLAHQLGVDWRRGERHFMGHLVDADLASNDLGWQWAVGTGVDPVPHRRSFNPRLQGERFDPDGDFVRRWLPELKQVPMPFIHHPWDMPARVQEQAGCVIGRDYPGPLVPPAVPRTHPTGGSRDVQF
ncbi:MAG: cryptochrome/photolyase family protein [Candidatus Dormibacteria bacterium]